MTRPLRVEFPAACYHVINRGSIRFPVFEEERDRELILNHSHPTGAAVPCPCPTEVMSPSYERDQHGNDAQEECTAGVQRCFIG
jgi:hypothetical protein